MKEYHFYRTITSGTKQIEITDKNEDSPIEPKQDFAVKEKLIYLTKREKTGRL